MIIMVCGANAACACAGIGKNHKDAASVRATHPIPAACGLYYFEVKIVSKGRDGYMGVGLSAQGVNMNRLPGWDKQSYGYHGDDGHSFCSSGTGQPYGPTFTTGDVIGCAVNLINNTCFYTKNGHDLGIAFTDLPPNLYPTVGLQTPGEVVDANFGQSPFVFDIEDCMKALRMETSLKIQRFGFSESQGEWETLHRIVQTYLVHHGYCTTAEAFAKSTGQRFEEEIRSIKNRQRIQKLVLEGRIGEALDMTKKLYPGLLDQNPNLLFMLKCRQFVEIVNGSDGEVPPPATLPYRCKARTVEDLNAANLANGSMGDVEMDEDYSHITNGNSTYQNGGAIPIEHLADSNQMDLDPPPQLPICGGSTAGVERMLQFGRDLNKLSQQLKREMGSNPVNKKMKEDAFSLLAYADPWSSPVGYQLDPIQREPVCAALNSAILESQNLPQQPPLEVAIAHTRECIRLMSQVGLGACAFADLDSLLRPPSIN
ncbi:RANBP10 [Cordylochernes scorpioides]|uniref:RANBP10 n=1 Tax=Cordylochernes scorpioides TaxID=51811 RepID=A0ABY6K2R7_9ARAC|nr:RANBP10 [Cordylochernes scorpioides]